MMVFLAMSWCSTHDAYVTVWVPCNTYNLINGQFNLGAHFDALCVQKPGNQSSVRACTSKTPFATYDTWEQWETYVKGTDYLPLFVTTYSICMAPRYYPFLGISTISTTKGINAMLLKTSGVLCPYGNRTLILPTLKPCEMILQLSSLTWLRLYHPQRRFRR